MMDFGSKSSSAKMIRTTKTSEGELLTECDKVEDRDKDWPTISEGGLNHTYIFHQVHFHWGKVDGHGSEHAISNTFFPMEIQIYHYKSTYKSMKVAMKKPDGIAALSILVQAR